MPASLAIRAVHVHVKDKTKRVRHLVIATTLLDARTDPVQELGGLFRQRWHAELAGPALAEDAYAHGDAADQEPGDGAQGRGDASFGLHLDPRGD
jgi:hypothetical protein